MWATLLYVVVGLLLLVGLLGSLLPFIPGTLLILAGAFLFALGTDFQPVGPGRLLVLAGLTAAAYSLDYLAGALGARKLGRGSRWAMAGALLGALVGLFFGPVGLITGPILGAVTAEMAYSRKLDASLRSGLGTMLGILLGVAARLSIAVIMVGLFLWWVWRG